MHSTHLSLVKNRSGGPFDSHSIAFIETCECEGMGGKDHCFVVTAVFPTVANSIQEPKAVL